MIHPRRIFVNGQRLRSIRVRTFDLRYRICFNTVAAIPSLSKPWQDQRKDWLPIRSPGIEAKRTRTSRHLTLVSANAAIRSAITSFLKKPQKKVIRTQPQPRPILMFFPSHLWKELPSSDNRTGDQPRKEGDEQNEVFKTPLPENR